MAQQDDLYELVQSLSPGEKRYFKMHADKYEREGYKSNYEKLYDALQYWPHKTFDEKQFRKANRSKTFLKNLAAEKSYLKDLLLKTLRNYHSENDTATTLHEMLLDIRVLINKGLKQQAVKIIERAIEIASAKEYYSELLLLHDFLLDVYKIDRDKQLYTGAEIAAREVDILEQMALTRQAIHLRVAMTEIYQQVAWKERKAEVEAIMKKATRLLQSPHLPIRAGASLLNVKQYYLIYHHQHREALDMTHQWLFESIPSHVIEDSTDQYRAILANYLLCALQCEEFDLMPDAIAKIKAIDTRNNRTAADCFRLAAQYELVYLINKVQLDGASEMLKHIEDGMRRFKHFISESHAIHFTFNIALLYFLQKKYDKALGKIKELQSITGRDDRYLHSTTMARTMEWMSLRSTRRFDELENGLRNLKRYLKDRALNAPLFELIIEFYTMLYKEADIKPASLRSFRKQFAEMTIAAEWEQLRSIIVAWI